MRTKRVVGAVMSMILILTSFLLPEFSMTANAEDGLILHYDMSHSEGMLIDISGNCHHGVLKNIDDRDFKTHEKFGTYLHFDGQAAGAAGGKYVELPASIADGVPDKTNFTVQIKFDNGKAGLHWLWCLGTNSDDYLFINPRSDFAADNDGIIAGLKTGSLRESRFVITGTPVPDHEKFCDITLTSKGNTMKIFLDGEQVMQLPAHAFDVSRIWNGSNGVLGYIGKSLFAADPYYSGDVSDFKIFNRAFSDREVKEDFYSGGYYDSEKVLLDALQELFVPGTAIRDIDLPTQGAFGTTVRWSSDNTAISDQGNVTLGNTRQTVKLIATVSLDGLEKSKTFSVVVPAESEALSYILDEFLRVPYVLTEDDVLPQQADDIHITWESDDKEVIADDGTITAPLEGLKKVSLKATVSADGFQETREFSVLVMEKESNQIACYTRNYDAASMSAHEIIYSMHLGFSEDGRNFEAMRRNSGILYAAADRTNGKAGTTLVMQQPYLFRMEDGSFGVVAKQTQIASTVNYKKGTILRFTSDNLTQYTEEALVNLHTNKNVNNPICEYNPISQVYKITWKDDEGNVYCNTTTDFTNVSNPLPARQMPEIDTTVIGLANAVVGNKLLVTRAEGAHVTKKLRTVVNNGVNKVSVTGNVNQEIDMSKVKATATYSDDSTADKVVNWEQDKVKFDKAGTYTINGTIKMDKYTFPMIYSRADPNAIKYNGKYYFIATEDQIAHNIYIRCSDTLTGLADKSAGDATIDGSAAEHRLLDIVTCYNNKGEKFQDCLWAPELHVVNGKLCVFFSASVVGTSYGYVQSHVMVLKDGGDPLNAADWGTPMRFSDKNGADLLASGSGITLDMTYFRNEYDGKDYVIWAERPNGGASDLWIGSIDSEKPWKLTSEKVCIAGSDYGWDRFRTTVIEGPYVIQRNGKIYCTFSGSSVSEDYAVGLTTAESSADLLTRDAWVRTNYPILDRYSVSGQPGPGHNSYVEDEDGNLVNVFHAYTRYGYSNRDTGFRKVYFGFDGEPVLDMTNDREVLPKYRKVTATITIEDSSLEDVEAVIARIKAIGTVTLDSRAAIADARNAYRALSEVQRRQVTNIKVLEEAEKIFAKLEKEEADRTAAQAVVAKIAAIGNVTPSSKAAIEAAEKAFNALTAEQKQLVTNYQILTAARSTYNKVIAGSTIPAKGTRLKNGKYYYKVIKSAAKNGTVELQKPVSKKMRKAEVPATIKLNGYIFKVAAIREKAFTNNTRLQRVTIGKNVKTIGTKAFYKCKKLKLVVMKPTKLKVKASAFKAIDKKAVIKVPAKRLAAYRRILKGKIDKKVTIKKS